MISETAQRKVKPDKDAHAKTQAEAKPTGGNDSGSLEVIESILSRTLFEPIRDLVDRPSKQLRAQLVQAGFTLASPLSEVFPSPGHAELCTSLADCLEAIHAGSLIIDDIQDESCERRGSPCLHKIHGVPVALNAGNWLYFQPFEWISSLSLDPKIELGLYRLCHEAMLRAHVGQAIDIGTKFEEMDQAHAKTVCMTSLRLKTGALTSLAMTMGACIAGATPAQMANVAEFGTEFGVALQMFDDIGNFRLPDGSPKRLEDFRLRRPTWLWACAAESCSEKEYKKFLNAIRKMPDEKALIEWVEKNDLIQIARSKASIYFEQAFYRFSPQIGGWGRFAKTRSMLEQVAERIRSSYG